MRERVQLVFVAVLWLAVAVSTVRECSLLPLPAAEQLCPKALEARR